MLKNSTKRKLSAVIAMCACGTLCFTAAGIGNYSFNTTAFAASNSISADDDLDSLGLPTTEYEFDSFVNKHGNVCVLKSKYVVYCDNIASDGGYELCETQSRENALECIKEYTIAPVYDVVNGELPDGTPQKTVKVYKASPTYYGQYSVVTAVTMEWSQKRDWEDEPLSSIETEFKIYDNGEIKMLGYDEPMENNNIYTDGDELPHWIPLGFFAAEEFTNTYGPAHAQNGLICIVQKEITSVNEMDYQIKDTDGNEDKLVFEDYFAYDGTRDIALGYVYHVAVYQPEKDSKSHFALQLYAGVTGALEQNTELSFETDKDGNVTETDMFDWLPDSYAEYINYKNNNPTVAVRDGLIVYCDYVCIDGGVTLQTDISGTAELEEIYSADLSRQSSPSVPGEGGNYIKVYKPKKAGTINITWKTGKFKPMFRTDKVSKVIDRSYEVDENGNITETFDWGPKNVEEYDEFMKNHEAVSFNGDYILYCGTVSPWCNLKTEQNGSAKLELIGERYFYMDNVDDSPTYYVAAYKFSGGSDDTVTMTWKQELAGNNVMQVQRTFGYKNNGGSVFLDTVKTAGDANGNGVVELNDAVMLKRWLLRDGDLECFANADLNDDYKVNVVDQIILKRKLVDLRQYSGEESPVQQ